MNKRNLLSQFAHIWTSDEKMGGHPRLHLALQAWRIASRWSGVHVAADARSPSTRPTPQVHVEQGRDAPASTRRTGPARWPTVIMGDSATPDAPGPRVAATVGTRKAHTLLPALPSCEVGATRMAGWSILLLHVRFGPQKLNQHEIRLASAD